MRTNITRVVRVESGQFVVQERNCLGEWDDKKIFNADQKYEAIDFAKSLIKPSNEVVWESDSEEKKIYADFMARVERLKKVERDIGAVKHHLK